MGPPPIFLLLSHHYARPPSPQWARHKFSGPLSSRVVIDPLSTSFTIMGSSPILLTSFAIIGCHWSSLDLLHYYRLVIGLFSTSCNTMGFLPIDVLHFSWARYWLFFTIMGSSPIDLLLFMGLLNDIASTILDSLSSSLRCFTSPILIQLA